MPRVVLSSIDIHPVSQEYSASKGTSIRSEHAYEDEVNLAVLLAESDLVALVHFLRRVLLEVLAVDMGSVRARVVPDSKEILAPRWLLRVGQLATDRRMLGADGPEIILNANFVAHVNIAVAVLPDDHDAAVQLDQTSKLWARRLVALESPIHRPFRLEQSPYIVPAATPTAAASTGRPRLRRIPAAVVGTSAWRRAGRAARSAVLAAAAAAATRRLAAAALLNVYQQRSNNVLADSILPSL